MWTVMFHLRAEARANSSLSPTFCKSFVEHAMSVCLHIVYGFFHSTMSDLTSFDRDHMPCKTENIHYPALNRKKVYLLLRVECRQITSTSKFFCEPKNVKLHSDQAASQNYFQNNMKTLFIFFILFSPSAQWSFPEATWCVMSQQTTCRSRQEIQLFSLKPDIKEVWKKQCQSSD